MCKASDFSLAIWSSLRGQVNLVTWKAGIESIPASASNEVAHVVELIIEHFVERPDESLGVIALGVPHSRRIEEALRVAPINRPEVAALLEKERGEPLFIKNLERVQGDERDASILTVVYAKGSDGRMRYNFASINQVGGQRRLNVAITRARRRMTVVSSFSGTEMDPERTTSVGAKMLRDYLLYAESGGTNLGLRARVKPVLNPFERDVQEQLEQHGVIVIPQYGASGYWIDFAAMHPQRRSEPVLAIEADGVMYHSSETARDRDRLRQEHLERLGWRFHRIWSSDWFRSRDSEVQHAVAAYHEAIEARDQPRPSVNSNDVEPAPYWLPDTRGQKRERVTWPDIPRNFAIDFYSLQHLIAVVRWVKSDGRLYTDEELLYEVMAALGFARRGPALSVPFAMRSRSSINRIKAVYTDK